ncbi:MAG TPA: pyridoxamine 5'-phosphate oxidase family protein [Nocardioidaceae bacterium]|nr:pyridoxamine 5'-phosphate oxidase family protein [Nocardioidaceae bacterium]
MSQKRQLNELPREEALRRLASVPIGRIVFTIGGLPTIRPVVHVLDDDDVVVRTQLEATTYATNGAVVAYEADVIDLETRTGWSTSIAGVASVVEDPAELERFEDLIKPMSDQPVTYVLRIKTDEVSGYEVVEE